LQIQLNFITLHKGVILIVKADDANEAQEKVEEFLEMYNGVVWDWYVIGGRWSGILNKLNQRFLTAANRFMAKKCKVKTKELRVTDKLLKECANDLNAIWEKMGGTGSNPYERKCGTDIMPLSECTDIVKKWKRDLVKEANKAFRQLCIERKKEREARMRGDKHCGFLSAYHAGLYKDAVFDSFCFESNTYDIDVSTNDPTKALDNPEGRWAVIVDLHN